MGAEAPAGPQRATTRALDGAASGPKVAAMSAGNILVCAGVWIMRRKRPDVPRGFVVPALPVVSTLGVIVCGAMIYGLGWTNWLRLAAWLVLGLVFYFGYARSHSRLAGEQQVMS